MGLTLSPPPALGEALGKQLPLSLTLAHCSVLADVDECALAEKACRRRDENCYNTPGSFVCVCPDGYEETDDACVPTPTPAMGTGE